MDIGVQSVVLCEPNVDCANASSLLAPRSYTKEYSQSPLCFSAPAFTNPIHFATSAAAISASQCPILGGGREERELEIQVDGQ